MLFHSSLANLNFIGHLKRIGFGGFFRFRKHMRELYDGYHFNKIHPLLL